MSIENIQDFGSFIKVLIPNTKTKQPREFTISEGSINGVNLLEVIRKYINLRPKNINHLRFFVAYRKGKCTSQPVGINTFGTMPKKIAEFLNLPQSEEYTGHCFRRSSTSLLADAGADMSTLKRHGGWKSSTVAEGYVETSLENKRQIATKILGAKNIAMTESINKSSTVDSSAKLDLSSSSGVKFSNIQNCVINIYNK